MLEVLGAEPAYRQSPYSKVSKTPVEPTYEFFDVRSSGRLVDLPGYGYAKAGKEAQIGRTQ